MFEATGLAHAPGRPAPDEDITVGRRALAELPGALTDAASLAAFALWRADGAGRAGAGENPAQSP